MSAFKKYYSLSPRAFRRSLSEQDAGTAALKDYHWHHRMRSKKMSKQMVLDPEKALGAYRWQTHPRLPWRISKRARSCSLRGEGNDSSLVKSSTSMDATSTEDLQQDSTEMLFQARTRSPRVPFNRSLSEPVPQSASRNAKPFLQAVRSVDCEQHGYFVRGIFSTLSSGFSKIINRRGEQSPSELLEWKTDDSQIDTCTGLLLPLGAVSLV
ncbi:uncharacterized protein LOC122180996 [Lagopus leucura]|uniref:uncharacterized protein LOC122180996 n=1 Tax=Lagopus leucura TaxID=30410 RepID=UPI001C680963|nr:uncharacterized protein LOC122180996 [Lagopus leucura]